MSKYRVCSLNLQVNAVDVALKINLTCLIENVDFTENILKIANNGYMPVETFGEYLYIFVTEAETTDNLSEQKIKGNLIFFAS